MAIRCPGAARFKQPQPGYYDCPNCGADVEIWTDEISHDCPECGTRVYRVREQSCIDHCEYARECLGDAKYERLMQQRKK